jgi:hypothetical protein
MKKVLLHISRYYSGGIYVMLSAFALLLGGIIYIFFRPSEHVFFDWIRAAGLDHWFNLAREWSLSSGLLLPEWIVYSLPNGLWAFAYASLITMIWGKSKSWLKYLWMASIPVFVLGYEVLQYAMIIPGTFSIQDMVFGIAGLIIGIIVGSIIFKTTDHEKAIE